MSRERLQLTRADWARYFAPVAICGYIAAICAALIITATFLANRQQGVAISAAGLFGLMMACALGAVLLLTQLRELRYISVRSAGDAHAHFQSVRELVHSQGWRVVKEATDERLEARTAGSVIDAGELIVVQFRGEETLVACICDPSVGFSLVGQRRCQHNRELLLQALAK
jgi:hypothetical protein